MLDEIEIVVSGDESFDQTEAPRVIREFVCAVCHSELAVVFAKSHWRVLVVCPEHGNITRCGRVMRSSVSIEMERAHSRLNSAIRALPDLWGGLIPARQSKEQNLRELGF